jgi:hypothetical protein
LIPEIVKVARQFALDPVKDEAGEYSCPCPFHDPQSSEPTLVFAKDKFGWFFKCWMCGAGGRDGQEFTKLIEAAYKREKEAKEYELLVPRPLPNSGGGDTIDEPE